MDINEIKDEIRNLSTARYSLGEIKRNNAGVFRSIEDLSSSIKSSEMLIRAECKKFFAENKDKSDLFGGAVYRSHSKSFVFDKSSVAKAAKSGKLGVLQVKEPMELLSFTIKMLIQNSGGEMTYEDAINSLSDFLEVKKGCKDKTIASEIVDVVSASIKEDLDNFYDYIYDDEDAEDENLEDSYDNNDDEEDRYSERPF